LNKAYEIQKQMGGEEDPKSAPTLTLISNCFTKMKDYDNALEYIGKVHEFEKKLNKTKRNFLKQAKTIMFLQKNFKNF